MKRDKNLKQRHSESKVQWLRMGLIWGFVLAFGIINCGCDKKDSDEYYVKYIINSSTIYFGGKLNVTINTENTDNMAIVKIGRASWRATVYI